MVPPPPVASLLAIQGGGFKGYFSALLLRDLETFKRLLGGAGAGRPLAHSFDMISGTSAGAILAAGLAVELPAETLADRLLLEGPRIFPARWFGSTWPGVICSRFKADVLREVLGDVLGDRTLGSVAVPLLIPAMNLTTGRPTLFRSWNPQQRHIPLVDVVMASAAAPAYLPRHWIEGSYYADGGLVANGPALLAARDMARVFEVPIQRQRIVSIGTTYPQATGLASRGRASWGLLPWGVRLIETFMDGQMKLQEEILRDLDPIALVILDGEVAQDEARKIHLVRADTAAQQALAAAAGRCAAGLTEADRIRLRDIFARTGRQLGARHEYGMTRPCLVARV